MHSVDYILDKSKFVKDGSMAFDFSNNHDITIIQYLNFARNVKYPLEEFIRIYTEHYKVNSVVICAGSSTHEYRANIDGFVGLDSWDDPFYIGSFLNELCIRNRSKYNVGFSDCGGAFTAMLTSKRLKFNSLCLTTPIFTVIPPPTIDKKMKVVALDIRQNMFDKASKFKEYYDSFPQFLNCVNEKIPISAHWARHVRDSDVFEFERVSAIKDRPNLSITQYDMPVELDPHLLLDWLAKNRIVGEMIRKEIALGEIYLGAVAGYG